MLVFSFFFFSKYHDDGFRSGLLSGSVCPCVCVCVCVCEHACVSARPLSPHDLLLKRPPCSCTT